MELVHLASLKDENPRFLCSFLDPIMVMFEYIPYGDLLGFLRRSRGLDDKYYKDPDVKPSSSLTSQQLLRFAREIADGMAFLAANKVPKDPSVLSYWL